MKTLKEEKAEYDRRIEVREAYENAKDSPLEIEIEATEKGGGCIDPLESFSPSWNYDEYDYRIKPELIQWWSNVYEGIVGYSRYPTKKTAIDAAGEDVQDTILMCEVKDA